MVFPRRHNEAREGQRNQACMQKTDYDDVMEEI